MDAVLLALVSAFLFGAMTVALRFALRRAPDAELGALLTIVPAVVVTVPFVVAQPIELGGIWPFLLAGILGPGLSQLLFTIAVRDAGPSRTSVAVGTAPLFSVVIALIFLGEPLQAGLVLGAILIVVGGVLLVGERGRPEHVKRIGLVLAFASAVVFAVRDNLVRWLSIDTDVSPALAALATLGAGGACVAAYVLATRRGRVSFGVCRCSCPPGSCSGSRTSACSRPTTAAASRSSRRSSRPSRSGASASRCSYCAATSGSACACSAAPCSSSREAR